MKLSSFSVPSRLLQERRDSSTVRCSSRRSFSWHLKPGRAPLSLLSAAPVLFFSSRLLFLILLRPLLSPSNPTTSAPPLRKSGAPLSRNPHPLACESSLVLSSILFSSSTHSTRPLPLLLSLPFIRAPAFLPLPALLLVRHGCRRQWLRRQRRPSPRRAR